MIFGSPPIILPPEKPAIIRAANMHGLPSWQEMQRRERAIKEQKATFPFPLVPPAQLPSISLIGTKAETADTTSYTFDFTDFSGGLMVVGFWSVGNSATGRTVSSINATDSGAADHAMTLVVNGSAAAQHIGALYSFNANGLTMSSVTVTFNLTMLRLGWAVWQLLNLDSTTATDTDFSNLADPASGTVDCLANGGILSIAGENAASSTTSWTNLTERDDFQLEGTTGCVSCAHDVFTTAQTARTVTADFSVGTATFAHMCVASFR